MKEYIVSVQDDELDFEEVFIAYIREQTELIRCKDCKLNGVCVLSNSEDGFCAWAKPKEEKR